METDKIINGLKAIALISGTALGGTIPIVGGLLGNIFGNLMTNKIEEIKLKELFGMPHPTELNHDLEKLIINAVVWGIKNVAILYKDVYPIAYQKLIKSDINEFVKNIENKIEADKISADDVIYSVDGLVDRDTIIENLYLQLGTLPDPDSPYSFKQFFKEQFPDQFKLCFAELLKDEENTRARIAYERNVMTSIRKNILDNKTLFEEKFDEINQKLDALEKSGGGDFSKLIENELESVIRSTNKKVDIIIKQNEETGVKLDEILKETRKVTIILEKADQNILKLNVNGELKESENSYSAFRKYMVDTGTPFFTFDDVLYDINKFDAEKFEYLSGRIAINELLVVETISSLSHQNREAKKFIELTQSYTNWHKQENILAKAKQVIGYSLVGILGKEFVNLMAIGADLNHPNSFKYYTDKSKKIINISLDMFLFIAISELWDMINKDKFQLDTPLKKLIRDRLTLPVKLPTSEKLRLLFNIASNSPQNNYPLSFIKILSEILKNPQVKSELGTICTLLDATSKKTDLDKMDCYAAEMNVKRFVQIFIALLDYKMISIKRIGYRQPKNNQNEPTYLHRYTNIGIDNKANIDAEKVNLSRKGTYTDAILLYKGDNYDNAINLFPLIVDYNTLTLDHGSKICFFQCSSFENDSLEYEYIDDDNILRFEHHGVLDSKSSINDVFLSKEKYKEYNVDCLVEAMNELKQVFPDYTNDFGDL